MSIYRGSVVGAADPQHPHRLEVRVPSLGETTMWAPMVVAIGTYGDREVAVGTEVWVALEGDDPALPVVLGLAHPPDGRAAFTLEREALGDAWDRGHATGSNVANGGDTPNPYRDRPASH